ncbi:uncharacterized protein LOC126690228 [Quercus robur]|uniref:uncharacterized protein LOC126690228 n=1 Tax=Quercus robur TaxID=38942 RepID=UPI002162A413|nr:uncharacterized protein LOC126690228 [Quercus robur]
MEQPLPPKDLGGMGFKELQKFNDAMLAKQGNILEAKEGNGSFTWKSILKGREIIKKGANWKVGCGENIRIYHDRWLPDPNCANVQSPPIFYGSDAQVSVLIDKDRSCWIEDVVDNNFHPLEAKMIKSIPLCFTVGKDKLYWPGKVDGVYSVKAGYRFFIEDELSSIAASDALPSRVNLMKRKVLSDATCQVCGSEPESSLHALWMCSKLDMVWDAHFGPLRNDAKDCSNFLEVIQVCMEKGHPTDLVAMTTSLIWTRRNKLRLGESVPDLRLLHSMARDALQEFHHAHTPAPSPTHTRSLTEWEPPPMDWVKINFDGAIFKAKGEAGLGAIIRNDHGLVMAALAQVIPLPTSVEMVEVLEARRALSFAQELGFDHII